MPQMPMTVGALRDVNGTPYLLKQRIVDGDVVSTWYRQPAEGFLEEVLELRATKEEQLALLTAAVESLERAVSAPATAHRAVAVRRANWRVRGS